MYFIGRYRKEKDKAQVKCKTCNRLDGRIATMKQQSGHQFAKNWDSLDKEGVAEFMKQYSELKGTALGDAMVLHMERSRTNTTSVGHGHTGQYWPLDYYRNNLGFSQPLLDSIQANADSQWDTTLQCEVYAYDVEHRHKHDTEVVANKSTWTPRDQESHPPSKRAKIEDGTAHEGSHSPKSEAAAKRAEAQAAAKKAQEKAREEAKQAADAKKELAKKAAEDKRRKALLAKQSGDVVGKIGATITKMTNLSTRMTPVVKSMMPVYIVELIANTLQTLLAQESDWKGIFNGERDSLLDENHTKDNILSGIKDCNTVYNDAETLLRVVERQAGVA